MIIFFWQKIWLSSIVLTKKNAKASLSPQGKQEGLWNVARFRTWTRCFARTTRCLPRCRCRRRSGHSSRRRPKRCRLSSTFVGTCGSSRGWNWNGRVFEWSSFVCIACFEYVSFLLWERASLALWVKMGTSVVLLVYFWQMRKKRTAISRKEKALEV